jgi:hypothetical protein
LALAAALSAESARADVVRVFEANGVFNDGVTLRGTLTIDVTAGEVTAANLLLGAPVNADFTVIGPTEVEAGDPAQVFRPFGLSSSAS